MAWQMKPSESLGADAFGSGSDPAMDVSWLKCLRLGWYIRFGGDEAGSDTANLSVMGYDPKKKYYTGRSPLEALSIGVPMKDTDVAIRYHRYPFGRRAV